MSLVQLIELQVRIACRSRFRKGQTGAGMTNTLLSFPAMVYSSANLRSHLGLVFIGPRHQRKRVSHHA